MTDDRKEQATQFDHVRVSDYMYELPEEKIADAPVTPRDESRLLIWRGDRNREILHSTFRQLPDSVPPGSLFVANDSRVVRARVTGRRNTGGRVEMFLMDPSGSSIDPSTTLSSGSPVEWQCLVRPLKRLKQDERITLLMSDLPVLNPPVTGPLERVSATFCSRTATTARIRFDWAPEDIPFADVLEQIGHVPLPPYLRREDRGSDVEDYQTVFSGTPGAVAAPTAGLHLTDRLIKQLGERGSEFVTTTLFVGAGTFLPIKVETASEHAMHREYFRVSADAIDRILRFLEERTNEWLVVVGTTTLRTLESLYYVGARMLRGEAVEAGETVAVAQWEGIARSESSSAEWKPDFRESLEALSSWFRQTGATTIEGTTELMIVPGVPIHSADVLITNFHIPGSTLLMLVAAFTGEDSWRKIYGSALANSYRFLSYGDSSLLVRPDLAG